MQFVPTDGGPPVPMFAPDGVTPSTLLVIPALCRDPSRRKPDRSQSAARAGPGDRRDKPGMIATPGDTRTLAEREAEYDAFVAANLRRNFTAHFFHGMLGMTGFRLIYAPTFIPTYIHRLTGSDALVGLGTALLQFGAIISPIFSASRFETKERILPYAIRTGTMMRVMILGMALAGWFLRARCCWSSRSALFFLLGAFNGTQRVAFQMLMAKVIPIHRRGRLQAYRNVTGGMIAAALSYAAGRWLIGGNVLGNGYATTFFVAFVLTSMGLTVLRLRMVEPVPVSVRPPMKFVDRVKTFPQLLEDRGYRWFILAEACCVCARIGDAVLHPLSPAAARPVGHRSSAN